MKKILFFILIIPLLNACVKTENEDLLKFIFTDNNYEPFLYKGIPDDYYISSFSDDFSNEKISTFDKEGNFDTFKLQANTLTVQHNLNAILGYYDVSLSKEDDFEYKVEFKYNGNTPNSFGLVFNYTYGRCNYCSIETGNFIEIGSKKESRSYKMQVANRKTISNFKSANDWHELMYRKTGKKVSVFIDGERVISFKKLIMPYYGDNIGILLQNGNVSIRKVEFKRIKPSPEKNEE
jgi:hypothetical protein